MFAGPNAPLELASGAVFPIGLILADVESRHLQRSAAFVVGWAGQQLALWASVWWYASVWL